jgi:hypothetical protein
LLERREKKDRERRNWLVGRLHPHAELGNVRDCNRNCSGFSHLKEKMKKKLFEKCFYIIVLHRTSDFLHFKIDQVFLKIKELILF